ncbi:MAG: hypothetical protein FWD67_11985 [Betaproteobacteria bacterium]|nr:hypothetical protein [Betaproteobacteria bacterium]
MNDNPSPALPDMSDEERTQKNKEILLATLKAIGAKRATVSYSGSGDEGYADEVLIESQDGTAIEPATIVSLFSKDSVFVERKWQVSTSISEFPLAEALKSFAMSVLWLHHAGWENNDGGSGEVEFDPDGGEVCLHHNEYYTESNSFETVL